MSEKDAVSCLVTTAMLLLVIAASIVIGRFFGAAFGIAAFLAIVAIYLIACVVAWVWKRRKDT